MAKELITVANLDAYVRKDLGKLFITPNRLITAGAKDELRSRGVQLVYGDEPAPVQPAAPCQGVCGVSRAGSAPAGVDTLKRLAVIVVAILREQYGIRDEKELESLAVKILKTVRNSL
ncbi:MAG: hypothetical protein J1E80_06045 [Desulfovibrionaceae bacterium]|nr:hypothetical protein [Desulfovibrionaceae bacterium]